MINNKRINDGVIRTTTNVSITVRELYDLVYVKRLSDAKIGKIYGLSAKTIRNYRRKCAFETIFKTGRMDLPKSGVLRLIKNGKSYGEIAEYYNSTKTSVKAFCLRHGVHASVREDWPIDKLNMAEYIILEYSNDEIANRHFVTSREVLKLQSSYGLDPFEGLKTIEKYANRSKANDLNLLWGWSIKQKAELFWGSNFRYDDKLGYFLFGEHVKGQYLNRLVTKFEKINDVKSLLDGTL